MDVLLTIICAVVVLGFLVFIHEGGHYLASRAFGVRVSEFMIGLPGPSVSFRHGETRFGLTLIPLGGYARVCGMEPGEMHPHLKEVMGSLYARGTATIEDVGEDVGIDPDDAQEALEELVEWGCVTAPKRKDEYNTYRTAPITPTRRQIRRAARKGLAVQRAYEEGEPRDVPEGMLDAVFERELSRQYRNLPFWKRSVILVAGPLMNLLFAMLAFVIIYSIIGFDIQNTQTGEISHVTVDPLRAIRAGFMYIGMVVEAVAGLFNPMTVSEVVSDSASVVGIAIISKQAAEAGFVSLLEFMAMISVSLGVMNLLPIPPLDGGRFVVEIYQRLRRRNISARALSNLTIVGMALFMLLFLVTVNQDIQRIVTGFWN